MGRRSDRTTTCLTWSSIPAVVPESVNLIAALRTIKGSRETADELVVALDALHEMSTWPHTDRDVYHRAARSAGVVGEGETTVTTAQVYEDILETFLDRLARGESFELPDSPKGGVMVRAWVPTPLAHRWRDASAGRHSQTAMFLMAAQLFLKPLGVSVEFGNIIRKSIGG